MKTYRVIDLRQESAPETAIHAHTPEAAASSVLGVEVVRGGNRRALVAKVYSDSDSGLSMVRLYSRAEGRIGRQT